MSRRTKIRPTVTLRRDPLIAGRDSTGRGWIGIDATQIPILCSACGQGFQYGYAPMGGSLSEAVCVGCVVFEEVGA